MKVLVTGGYGFIGSNFVTMLLQRNNVEEIVIVDSCTYAADPNNLGKWYDDVKLKHYVKDICNTNDIDSILEYHKPDYIVHFAAESHVDRSITNSSEFIRTNVLGTHNLLDCVLYQKKKGHEIKFLHVSTDEVYGSLELDEKPSTEESLYKPRSPYAASKAASDHLVLSYYHTHDIPVIVTNCSNNYGPRQNVEKFIPTIITKALKNERIPVYGIGVNIRDWIHVSDHCNALITILERDQEQEKLFPNYNGKPVTVFCGQKYNIGGSRYKVNELSNLNLTFKILTMMNKPFSLIEFVEDRKGHDLRYAINNDRISNHLCWAPIVSLDNGLKQTIEWYSNEQNSRNNISGWEIITPVSSNSCSYQTTTSRLR